MSHSPTRENQAGLIAQTLRSEILRGILPAGKGLAEPRLAERFGVSRAPVREALFELSAEGYLEFQPNGRTRIISLNQRDFQEIVDVRSALESLAARRAAPQWTEADSRTVRGFIEGQAKSQTLHELGELDVAMHALMIERAGNRRLFDLWQRIRAQFSVWLAHTHRVLDAMEAKPREESVANHLRLLEAFETRDPETAARAAQEHVEIWRQKLPDLLPQPPSIPKPGTESKGKPSGGAILGAAFLALVLAMVLALENACQAAVPAAQSLASQDAFTRQILPIFEKHCFECHSHAHKIKGGLSLDFRSGWQKGGDSGPAIVPGNVADSLLLRAVNHEDKDLAMPPKKKISPEEIALLTEWVRSGAVDPRGDAPKKATDLEEGRKHWAFQPVSDPEPPRSAFPEISNGAIDSFLFEKISGHGLRPSAPADRATLLRRATYDLTGLPPTARELELFMADPRPDSAAFATVIERLLDSTAYGEKWARLWLDVIRFADTTGCSSDWPIDDAWRYRDWVARAFQTDLPFPQFVSMQIAGDILARDLLRSGQPGDPAMVQDHLIATGFLALSKRFGSNPNAFEHLTIADTLDNSWRALQGLSMGCARCHDHKFEPLFHKDYYALYGIFASSHYPYPGSELSKSASVLVPLDLSRDTSALDHWNREVVAAAAAFPKTQPRTVLASSGSAWGFEEMERSEAIETRMPGSPWVVTGEVRVVDTGNSPFVHLVPHGSQAADFPATVSHSQLLRRVRWNGPATAPLLIAVDFQLSALWKTPEHEFTLAWRPAGDPSREVVLARTSREQPNTLVASDGQTLSLRTGTWHHLAFQCDSPTAPLSIQLWDELANPVSNPIASRVDTRPLFEEGDIVLRFDARQTNGKPQPCIRVDNVLASRGVPPAVSVLTKKTADPQPTPEEQMAVARDRIFRQLAQAKTETAFAMWEGTPRDVALHKRGEPENPGPIVPRRNLTLFGGDPIRSPQQESGRRDLARWLSDDSNPLTQRVYVNRLWAAHFGRGIVAGPNDFGHTGNPPTHPELLDYLVQQFRKSGYSTKAMHREILLSHAYRQAAIPSGAAAQTDPDNGWLSHFSARRLTAEELRDSVLSVSGLLDPAGPGHRHAFPAREARNWSQHHPFSIDYEKNAAPYFHRKRGLYLLTTRLVPDAFLSTFDGPDSNQSTASRQQSTVALQSLALMNDPLIIEAANRLAAEAQPDPEAAIEQIHLKIYGTPPPARTLALLRARLDLLTPTAARNDALAVVAQSLLTSNTFLYLR